MKIEVFLRHCYSSPNQALPNRKRPPWFDKVKVFENLKRTIDPDLAKINCLTNPQQMWFKIGSN